MRKLALISASVAALAGGALAASTSAQVGALDTSACNNARVCVFTEPSWGGQKKDIDSTPDQVWINLGGAFDNNINSLKQRFDRRKITFAHGTNGNGTHYCKNAGADTSNIYFPNFDEFESYRVGQPGSTC